MPQYQQQGTDNSIGSHVILILQTPWSYDTWFIQEGDTKIHPQIGRTGVPQLLVGSRHH